MTEIEKSVNYWRQRCINAESESQHRQETIDALQPVVQAAVALCQLNHFLWEDTQELVDFCSAVWDFEIRVEHKKVKKF